MNAIDRLLTNGGRILEFLKDFTIGSAQDVSITYINADSTEIVYTFSNISKMNDTFTSWLTNGVPLLRIGSGSIGTRTLNIKEFFYGAGGVGNIHIVTDIHNTQYASFCFKIIGQLLIHPLAIDTTIVGYIVPTSGLLYLDSTQLEVTAYVNSNGYVTLKITGNPSYASFTVDNIRVGNGGHCTITEILVSETDI